MNLFELMFKIGVEDNASEKIDRISSKVGNGLKKAAEIGTAALAAAASGVSALGKSSVEAYANYEQLIGGVETLFGEYAGKVTSNAEKAYKTAGLSANDYMETVTSFSASLLQSLEGNTWKAADMADLAIQDMSDNANKMGTDMSAIQNAYNGFAKQNYTMLDNLKLGYGGTKEEMARLLADAQELSGVEFKMGNFADIVEAIHVVQTEMGITGTTAREAATTIQGSASSMKASWTNLVTALSRDNANIDKYADEFIDSFLTFSESNLLPRVKQFMDGFGRLAVKAAPVISEYLPSIVTEIVPDLAKSAGTLIMALIRAIPGIYRAAKPEIAKLIKDVFNFAGLEIDADGIFGSIERFVSGFQNNILPRLQTAWEMLKPIAQKSIDALENIIDFAADIVNNETAVNILSGIATGITAVMTASKISNGLSSITGFLSSVTGAGGSLAAGSAGAGVAGTAVGMLGAAGAGAVVGGAAGSLIDTAIGGLIESFGGDQGLADEYKNFHWFGEGGALDILSKPKELIDGIKEIIEYKKNEKAGKYDFSEPIQIPEQTFVVNVGNEPVARIVADIVKGQARLTQ